MSSTEPASGPTDRSDLVSRSVVIDAPPRRVWELISDLPGMGEFSPESTGGQWRDVAGGAVVGAVFRGTNAQGRRRWSTRSTVVRSEPGVSFAFDVSSGGLPVAQWSYDLEPTDAGCRLTETWQDRRGMLVTTAGRLLTGISDRSRYSAVSIEQTLARVKQRAENGDGFTHLP